jgi:transposase
MHLSDDPGIHTDQRINQDIFIMLIAPEMKIHFYTQPVDMRKSIDTLCMLIADVLNMSPTNGSLFLFRSKSGDKLKALYYETNCFTLWYRRLEKGRFVFARDAQGHFEMSRDYFNWLLASDKYSRMEAMKANQPIHFY